MNAHYEASYAAAYSLDCMQHYLQWLRLAGLDFCELLRDRKRTLEALLASYSNQNLPSNLFLLLYKQTHTNISMSSLRFPGYVFSQPLTSASQPIAVYSSSSG